MKYQPIFLLMPMIAVLFGAIPTALADTGNSLPSTEQILQDANSPQVQSMIAQEAPQAGVSQEQGTSIVGNIVSGCISDIPSCIQQAGAFAGAVKTLIAMLG